MLLTKEVTMKWTDRNKRYFINKGYEYTGNFTLFTVKVEDLHPKGQTIVSVVCPVCKTEFTIEYRHWINNRNKDKYPHCYKCSHVKQQQTNIERYGVASCMNIESIKSKKLEPIRAKSYEKLKEYMDKYDATLLTTYDEFYNYDNTIKFTCNKHNDVTQESQAKCIILGRRDKFDYICHYCQVELMTGENSHNWQGGLTPIINYLRSQLQGWKADSMKNCNFKCIITNERFDVIHHLYGFNKIINESIDECNIILKSQISEYSQEDLEILTNRVIAKHYEYPLGVCLTKEIHALFHTNYGYGDNTSEQFNEFKVRYKAGEFN